MKAIYDREANALFVRLSGGKIAESEEMRPGLIIDFDSEGKIVGFEMPNARMQLPPDALVSVAAE